MSDSRCVGLRPSDCFQFWKTEGVTHFAEPNGQSHYMTSWAGRPENLAMAWLRRPSRPKMNSLRSALTAVSPTRRNNYPDKRDMNLPNQKIP
jgi:hypothetical protein